MNEITQQKYSPAITAEVRKNGTLETVKLVRKLGKRHPEMVHFHDPDAVRRAIDEYFDICEETQTMPTIEGFSVLCHVTKRWFNTFIERHGETESGLLLSAFATQCNAAKIDLNSRNCLSDAAMIFQLKNASDGYSDRIELAPVTNNNPMQDLDPEAARRRLLEAIPDDD